MKFTKLSTKFNKAIAKKESGKKVNSKKLEKLKELLQAKKAKYENKLTSADLSDEKRNELQTRLNVANAHIEKANELG